MSVQIEVVEAAVALPIGDKMRMRCPVCNSSDSAMVIRRLDNGNLKYWCYHNSCSTFGIINSRGKRAQGQEEPEISQYNYHDTYYLDKVDEKTAWLCKRFSLHPEEITRNKILYNRRLGSFVFPIYDGKNRKRGVLDRVYEYDRTPKALIYWATKEPSLYKAESPGGLYKGSQNMKTCIIVEDCISAIKASRYLPAYALCGTYLHPNSITYLFRNYDNVIMALDNDATSTAADIGRSLGTFMSYVVQHLPKDIKDMTEEELETLWNTRLSAHVSEIDKHMR